MERIERFELRMVEIKKREKRKDEIKRFVRKEKKIVKIKERDGEVGKGYRYKIGNGG